MAKDSSCDVVIVGAAFMDLQVYPVGREIADIPSYSAQSMTWSVGGDAINEATIITRLGYKARLLSCLGDDSTGSMVIGHMKENGIDTSYLKIDKEKTTSVNIGLIWKDGERTFINNRSGTIWTLGPEDIDLGAVSGGRILSFASIFNTPRLDADFMARLFKKARSEGMIICADVVSPKNGETLRDIRGALENVDYFFPNHTEACMLTGKSDIYEIADVFLSLGVGTVVLKIGKDGCLVKNQRECFIVPAYSRADCIDTTGAGDNFAAGFITGLLERKDLKSCAEFANCTASIAVETVGATEGLRTREQAESRYRDYLEML